MSNITPSSASESLLADLRGAYSSMRRVPVTLSLRVSLFTLLLQLLLQSLYKQVSAAGVQYPCTHNRLELVLFQLCCQSGTLS